MAEKRRPGAAPEFKSLKAESGEELLGQAGVRSALQGALLRLTELRPHDPITFLSQHFNNEAAETEAGGGDGDCGGGGDGGAGGGEGGGDGDCGGDGGVQEMLDEQKRLGRALWHLNLAHHSQRSAFYSNVRSAYALLSHRPSRGPAPCGLAPPGGIPGHLYNETLRSFCSEGGVPPPASAPLLRRLRCRDYEPAPPALFLRAALSCAVFREYVRRARRLYVAVATRPDVGADRALCGAVLGALRGALEATRGSHASRFLEASARISPGTLALAMAEARAANREQEGPKMDAGEFEEAAAALFIARVRVVG